MPALVISDTQIANMALSHVGTKSHIENLQEESPEARECDLWYDYVRLVMLEGFDWGFARKRIALTAHSDTLSTTNGQPYAGVWAYRYQYPTDCVVARKIQHPSAPPNNAIPFDVETSLDGKEKTILTNAEDAVLVYTWNQVDLSQAGSSFIKAMTHLLASEVAFALTGKRSVASDQVRIYQQMFSAAAASDANERLDQPPRDADWIRTRDGSGADDVKKGTISGVYESDASN